MGQVSGIQTGVEISSDHPKWMENWIMPCNHHQPICQTSLWLVCRLNPVLLPDFHQKLIAEPESVNKTGGCSNFGRQSHRSGGLSRKSQISPPWGLGPATEIHMGPRNPEKKNWSGIFVSLDSDDRCVKPASNAAKIKARTLISSAGQTI